MFLEDLPRRLGEMQFFQNNPTLLQRSMDATTSRSNALMGAFLGDMSEAMTHLRAFLGGFGSDGTSRDRLLHDAAFVKPLEITNRSSECLN